MKGNSLRIGSLFSGSGMLDYAVQGVLGGTTAWHSEMDDAASEVLSVRFPGVPNLGDITKVPWSRAQAVDVLCGGFPCQDVSAAGRRAGIATDTRSGLWNLFADAIAALKPGLVVIENVRGLLSAEAHRDMESVDAVVGDGPGRPVLRAAGAVLGDLADLGYDARWATVSASSVWAPHRRDRVFVVAHPRDGGVPEWARSARWESEQRPPVGAIPGCRSSEPVELLSTPQSRDYKGVPSDGFNNANLCRDVALLCTPSVADAEGGHLSRSGDRKDELLLPGQAKEIAGRNWGKYESAIRRWENITTIAPAPTEPNRNGNPRLNPAFSEWMMGWPAGWVTQVPGISRNDQLRIIGNGVVPQHAIAALSWLLSVSEVAA